MANEIKTVLVTGGSGFLGINLIRQIAVQAGWERKADKNRLTLMFEV